jgi:hypothetical protein
MLKCTDQLISGKSDITVLRTRDESGILTFTHPGANNNKRGKKFVVLPSFVATKITKLKNNFISKLVKKNI